MSGINNELQIAKSTARALYQAIDASDADHVVQALSTGCAQSLVWRGFHPFGMLDGPETVAEVFWRPLKTAFAGLHRREDIFFAGRNEIDGFSSMWVVSMGHLMGLFDRPWIGISPTGKIAMLRYCSFDRLDQGKIIETAMYFDIPHLMRQAGTSLFGPQTGQFLIHPGPARHDGLLFDAQPADEGARTLSAMNAMISDLGTWSLGLPLVDELARTWHPEMIWWGPEGIGSSYTIERYAAQHSAPFRAAFSERTKTKHIARLAEGHFGGFFGWPNFSARLTGPFMGQEPTGRIGEFRVIDVYRRAGDKLSENWVFIDLLHFWATQGFDYLREAVE